MSIAVSVLVPPSRVLFGLCTAMCCGCAALGLAFLLGAVPAISPIFAFIMALCCFALAGLGLRSILRDRQCWQLDISGTGQIRLRRTKFGAQDSDGEAGKSASDDGLLVRLLADSTMWPNFLLLRLQDGDGLVHRVAILPDSLPSDAFRAVSVACRWIAAHRFPD